MTRTPPHDGARSVAKLRAAFGPLYEVLLQEAPERAAWSGLSLEGIAAAMAWARERMAEPQHALGFRTLLKQELDEACELTPPAMSFEAGTVPTDRAVLRRAVRQDEAAREREQAAERRRDTLRAQARDWLTRPSTEVQQREHQRGEQAGEDGSEPHGQAGKRRR